MKVVRLRDNRFGAKGCRFRRSGDVWIVAESEGVGEQLVFNAQQRLLEQFKDPNFGTLESLARVGVVELSGSHLEESDRKGLRFLEYHPTTDGFRLDTGNAMGVLRFREPEAGASIQVEILSRFDKGDGNFFLNYLLSKALDIAMSSDSVAAQSSSLLDLMLDFLFVRKLGEATRGGLLRQYQTFRNNDWAFKGRLDMSRHIRENVPLMYGIAYEKREIDLDVPVNRMLFLAAQTVRRRRPELFERNEDAQSAFQTLQLSIPVPGDIRTVLGYRDCREPVIHPFYRETWEPLRLISRMILEGEEWQLFQDADEPEVSGVVFDGSWLWEEYVASVLSNKGFLHCGKGIGGGLPVFNPGRARFYPDFYKHDDDTSKRIVLDAKYKRSNPNGGRDDIHQILCYLLLTGAKLGGLVFPPVDKRCEDYEALQAEENGIITDDGGWSPKKKINTPYGTPNPINWSCYSWAAVRGNNWQEFCDYMETQEKELRDIVGQSKD